MQAWLDWTSYITGGLTTGCACIGSRSDDIRVVCADICFPTYQPTVVHELEESRDYLGLALAGQLFVVTCRCLSGDFGSAAVGMVVFCAGNTARCSLRSANLMGFIVLATSTGVLDSVGLLRHLWAHSATFLALPFHRHILTNLLAVSMVVAPISEMTGVAYAKESFLTPEMLFRPSPGMHMPPSSSMYNTPPRSRSQGQLVPHSNFAWLHNFSPSQLLSGGQNVAPSAPALTELVGFQQGGTGGLQVAGTGESGEHCRQCKQATRNSAEGWYGSGAYSQTFFCANCWAAWRARSLPYQ